MLYPLKCVESKGERRGEVVRLERRQLAEHEKENCLQRELRCEFCGRAVRACEMNPHLGENGNPFFLWESYGNSRGNSVGI